MKLFFCISIISCIILALISLVFGMVAPVGGLVLCISLTFEIRDALIPLKPGIRLGRNPMKSWYNNRGKLKRYRIYCIILYSILAIASVVSIVMGVLKN